MHIGFIEDTRLHGGTQIWVTEAAANFLEKGEDVTVLAPEDSFVANECLQAGARVVTYDWDIVTEKKAKERDIWTDALSPCDAALCTVHPPRKGFHCSVFAAECIKKAGIETVLMPKTGTAVPEYLREFYLPDETINVRVICIANFTKKYLVEKYNIPSDIIEVIYQGTEIGRFTSTPRARSEAQRRYKLPEGASPILGSVGSFEKRKGQIVILQAVKQLSKSVLPRIHAMFVGDGPDEEMLKSKTAQMGIEQHVSFFPFTRDPNYVFARIDILALPSLYKEGLPNVLLEAMSMSLPVIASEMAGVPEVVFNGETGYMIKPGDPLQLADAVLKIWEDHESYRRMAASARKLIEDNFDKKAQFDIFRSFIRKASKKP